MSRVAKIALVVVLVPVAAFLSLVLGLVVWGFSQFPEEITAPDPATVSPNVMAGFERHLGSNRECYATRLFLYRDGHRFSQLAFNVAGATAQLWVATFWSPSQRIAEIARQGYFGHGFHGVESAALAYFGRPAEQLSEAEVAALAFLTWSPSGTSPWCHRAIFEKRASEWPSLAQISGAQMLANLLPAPPGACEPAA